MEQAGLAVRVDRMGNIYGRRAGADPTAAPALTDSHLDSVATAGAFDGCLEYSAASRSSAPPSPG